MPSLHDDLLFDRLASLPFVESARDGVAVHDAVREVIRTDLEAIDPQTCQRYRRAAWQQLNHEAKSAAFGNLWRYSADLIFLINNPPIRRLLYVMIILAHDRRQIVRAAVTEHPTAAWLSRQVTEAFPWDTAPRYLLRDRDASYGSYFCNRVEAMGIKEVVTAPRSPWQNAYVERVICSIRRE